VDQVAVETEWTGPSRGISVLSHLKSIHPAIYWSILSGMAALIYQVVLQKVFSYVLGGALLSTTIVVAAYMSGLALGGLLAALFGDRLTPRRSQFLYISLEVGIAVCGLCSLVAYLVYLSMLSRIIVRPTLVHLLSSIAFRAMIALIALLPMTTLIGATLPVLVLSVRARVGRRGNDRSPEVVTISELYSANLLGAMAGVMISSYLILPFFGLWGATILAFVANLCIAVLVFRFRPAALTGHGLLALCETVQMSHKTDSMDMEDAPSFSMVWSLAFISGLIIFALEIIWTHLLATVIGTSIYAFANMLFAVLLALYLAARREERPGTDSRIPLSWLVLLGSELLAVSIPFYALSPLLFGVLGIINPGFFLREIARVLVACFLIVPVGILLSRIFPRLLAVGVSRERECRGVGFLLSINTFGCLVGLFLGNFVLIPLLGSEIALKGLAVVLGLIAWIVYRRTPRKGRETAQPVSRFALVLPMLALVALVVPSWPPSLLLSNRSTWFRLKSEGEYKPLLYLGEDAESGFVTVSRRSDDTIELRTNGKFQGNNTTEMSAQFSFGYLPALAAPKNEKAFVIGCGTGVTVRALADSGFQHIRLAELSKPILYSAKTFFHDANGGVLEDPRVTVIHDDGRNALALSRERYDVISVELTSIWFAGAANLYSTDFYSIVHQKLAPGGIFQQWVQFHHMRLPDLWILLNTVSSRFKHVALWSSGGQGQLLASDEPLSLDWQRIQGLAVSNRNARYITPEEIYEIPYQVILDDSGMQNFLAPTVFDAALDHNVSKLPLGEMLARRMVDSDLFPYLEYATPRGNALDKQEVLIAGFLAQKVKKPIMVPLRNVPAADLPLARTLLAYRNGACDEVNRLLTSGTVLSGGVDLGFLKGCTPDFSLRLSD
jgi:spermidine synthase